MPAEPMRVLATPGKRQNCSYVSIIYPCPPVFRTKCISLTFASFVINLCLEYRCTKKEITMRRVVEKSVSYRCSRCRTKHTNKRDALRCERMPVEAKTFKIGSRVENVEKRTCARGQKQYTFSGVVTKIIGPEPPDFEYEVKWLGGRPERLSSHVFLYQVKFRCPHCKEVREERYYAPELKQISRQ